MTEHQETEMQHVVSTAPLMQGPPSQTMVDGPLCHVESLKITQKVDADEVFTGGCWEKQNRYKLYIPGSDKKIYKAKEESQCFSRVCCAPYHELKVHIEPHEHGYEEYRMEKPFTCGCCAFIDICRPSANIYRKRDEKLVGRIQRPACGGCFTPTLDIFDGNNKQTGKVLGPMCCISPFCESSFKYVDMADKETGAQITREYPGCCQACCTDADDFTMKFDQNQNEDARATMIGTMLLLDFMHFEDDKAFTCCTDDSLCKLRVGDFYCCGCKVPCTICIPRGGK